MGTLKGLYFEKMIGSSKSNFANIMTIKKIFENEIKFGKIASTIPQQVVTKKPQGDFPKKKEGETSVVTASVHPYIQTPRAHVLYYP